MTLIVETGSGLPGANGYVTTDYVTAYLTARDRLTEGGWDSTTQAEMNARVIAATDYIDKRFRFRGVRLRTLIEGRVAWGDLDFSAPAQNGEIVVIGQTTYRYVTTLSQENDLLIGATAEEDAETLVLAILGHDDGTRVYETTRANTEVTAAVLEVDNSIVRVSTVVPSANGNTVVTTTDVTGATWTGTTLSGGIDEGPQPLSFPRDGLVTRDGVRVIGIPENLRQATAEYAVRAVSTAKLMPDPTVDATGQAVQRKMSKVGSLESEVEYVDGATAQVVDPYPEADRLLIDYLAYAGTYR